MVVIFHSMIFAIARNKRGAPLPVIGRDAI